MPTVSAVTIALNEEEMIEGCLRSVAWADEVIVVDGGSTDATCRIAQRHATRVVTRPWTNWGEQKSYALDLATGDWVLWIDADERLTPGLVDEVRRFIANPGPYVGLSVPIQYYVFGRPLRHGGFRRRKVRLFRRDGATWRGDVHTDLACPTGPLLRAKAPIRHLYIRDLDRALDKTRRLAGFDAIDNPRLRAHARPYDILWSPLRRFVGRLLLKLGILDGPPGVIAIGLLSLQLFLTHASLWQQGHFARGAHVRERERHG